MKDFIQKCEVSWMYFPHIKRYLRNSSDTGMSRLSWFLVALGLVIASFSVNGQQSIETFGKNRIQYKQFRWQYVSSENFDVYYYEDRRKVATEALKYIESEFDRITDLIGYPPYLKTKALL